MSVNHTSSPSNDNPNQRSAEIILRYVDLGRERIGDLEGRIAALKSEIEAIQADARAFVDAELPKLQNDDERIELASEFYWKYSDIIAAWAVADALGVKPGNVHNAVWDAYIPAKCRQCGKEYERQVTSRTNYNYYKAELRDKGFVSYTCPECDAKADQREREYWATEDAEIARLRALPYPEYLKTDHWKEMRRRMLKRAHFRCQVCNKGNTQLDVHHRTYERRGKEEYGDLIVLCNDCHRTFHENGRLTK